MRHRCLVILLFLAIAGTALAHGDDANRAAAPWWTRWYWDPLTIGSLLTLSALYGAGLVKLWRSAGRNRGVNGWQALAFGGAIVALVIALISPLDPLSDELSSAHMVQHMLLMMVAAPLFVLGAPALVMLWALPRRWRHGGAALLGRFDAWRPPWYVLWQPVLLFCLYAFTLWIWHLPALYEAALRIRWVHETQHIMFFAASCLFWRVLLDPLSRLRMGMGTGVLYLFLTSLHATVLGVFMALAPRPWYSDYVGRTGAWNLSALEDQQIAGFIMWMPACTIYAIVAATLFALLIRDEPQPTGGGAP